VPKVFGFGIFQDGLDKTMTRIYERCALVSVFGLVGVLLVTVLVNPPSSETAAPKAVLELPIAKTEPVAVQADAASVDVANLDTNSLDANHQNGPKFIPVKARGSETLLDGVEVRAPDPGHVIRPENSAAVLERTFTQMGYDLDSIATGEAEVPRVFLASMPGDIGQVRESKKRKGLFFKTVLPLVLQVNEEIAKDRKRLGVLIEATGRGVKTGPLDRLWLIVMSERYKTKRGDLKSLLKRVDVIPPSLALAQAAEESGWGTSRFVREGNAMFGQWTWSDAPGTIVPKQRDKGKTHKIRAFDSLLQSVRAYARNLNTHRAYRHLRKQRHQLRAGGRAINGMTLAEQLTSYSERGEEYVKTLRTIIGVNKLQRFDDAQLIRATDPSPVI
jgi:Bax protein